jgi:hypothetical protein
MIDESMHSIFAGHCSSLLVLCTVNFWAAKKQAQLFCIRTAILLCDSECNTMRWILSPGFGAAQLGMT